MNKLKLYQTPEHDCPYLADKISVTQFIDPEKIPDINMYTYLTRFGFRRSGEHLYRPTCPDCKACISIRIPVQLFTTSRSQQRCLNKAKHFEFIHCNAYDSDEHYQLYETYINTRHKGGDMYPPTRQLFKNFLLSHWANTQFMEIRFEGTLIACAVYDQLVDGLSAVYCYFSPDFSQYSPGKLAILKQIFHAKTLNYNYLYLGYQIDECEKMNYKNQYQPIEQFIDNLWQ